MIGGPIGWPIGGVIITDGPVVGTLSATLADATLSASGALPLKATLTKTLDAATLAAAGALPVTAALAKTLDDAAISFAGTLPIKANIVVTLDDAMLIFTGGPELTITDTEVLQLPVDCVLVGEQPFRETGRTVELAPSRRTETPSLMQSSVRRLSGDRPSFTITISKRGYD